MNPRSTVDPSLVWYVSYGSNCSTERLGCYLRGGTPPGGSRRNPGARDPRMPRRSTGVELPGEVYFAGESPQWGGGVAFFDPEAEGTAYAVAHLLTPAQLTDIATQEMYLDPSPENPLDEAMLAGESLRFGEGRYEHLIALGDLDGHRMLTFTAPSPHAAAARNPPTPAYLATLAAGLLESGRWAPVEVQAYLTRITSAHR